MMDHHECFSTGRQKCNFVAQPISVVVTHNAVSALANADRPTISSEISFDRHKF